MKKFLLFVFVAAAMHSSAQVSCNIDTTNNVQGITPTPDQFPCVVRTVYYEQVAQVVVPTVVAIATVDSFEVTSVSGIPAGMQYTSNPTNQVIPGGGRGCFVFYGTTSVPKGNYDIGFTGIAYIKVGGQPQKFQMSEQQAKDAGFELFIEVIEPGDSCRPQNTTGIAEHKIANTSLAAMQNLAGDEVMVAIKTTDAYNAKISVVNLLGETITTKEVQVNGDAAYMLNVSGASKGMHFVVLQTGNRVVTKKIMLR